MALINCCGERQFGLTLVSHIAEIFLLFWNHSINYYWANAHSAFYMSLSTISFYHWFKYFFALFLKKFCPQCFKTSVRVKLCAQPSFISAMNLRLCVCLRTWATDLVSFLCQAGTDPYTCSQCAVHILNVPMYSWYIFAKNNKTQKRFLISLCFIILYVS